MYPVEVVGLNKSYGKVHALNGLNFSVNPGEIFGIIGPDGSGKSTLFRILTTLLLPDSGVALVDGFDTVKDYKKIRNRIGYMPGRFSLYKDLTVEENLKLFATVFNSDIKSNYYLIEPIYKQLEPFSGRRAGDLSGGMKQKLALSCALIHKPSVLFLDEPTTGVDPVSRKEFWEMLSTLSKEGITIVVSTPYMDEASLCTRVALMLKGRILKSDTPADIVKSYTRELYSVKSKNISGLLKDLKRVPEVKSVFAFGEHLHLSLDSGTITLDKINELIIKQGYRDVYINKIFPTIEDTYMLFSEEDFKNGR